MNKLLLYFIKIIHVLLFLTIIITPFTNKIPLLFLYSFSIPFLLSHWGLNNDICSLTIAEEILSRKIYGDYNEDDCVTCKIIKPVYRLMNTKDQFSGFIWTSTLILWLFVMFKIYYMIQKNKITHPLQLLVW